jgi:DNA-binding transcriptional LysR family regulator
MKLEEYLGTRLFFRSKNQTVPTPEGERILKQAQKVIHEVIKLESRVAEEKGILTENW